MSERFELCSERAIASVIPAIPAPIMAILRGGEDEEPIVAIAVKSEGARMSIGDLIGREKRLQRYSKRIVPY